MNITVRAKPKPFIPDIFKFGNIVQSPAGETYLVCMAVQVGSPLSLACLNNGDLYKVVEINTTGYRLVSKATFTGETE